MAVLEGNDQLGQLWALIQELSEQLNQNRSIAVSLHAQTGNVKVQAFFFRRNQAVHSQTGFVLRRYNLDKTKEEYEAELERMNASMTIENQGLQHDNKQLNTLIKEYEQTLESLMSTFRNRAQDVQERELSLIREYETKLLARQEEYVAQDLATSTAISESLVRISHLLRQFLRSLGGEDADPPTTRIDDEENREPWTSVAASDYALEKEIELARLEKENEELRRMMWLVAAQPRPSNSETRPTFESPLEEQQRLTSTAKSGGTTGAVGPFGTYKRTRPPA
ncbi:hypothetical protein D9615_002999 [Tricholomella constricta]|uniref:Uncharacterized protein n=1 Tax=Tricholomella constricta TaxID=117010 RepID=A0A8H5M5Z1_9AGAR|nr:hypothetical protein D9615_002999 [Tricholomella constricta]